MSSSQHFIEQKEVKSIPSYIEASSKKKKRKFREQISHMVSNICILTFSDAFKQDTKLLRIFQIFHGILQNFLRI